MTPSRLLVMAVAWVLALLACLVARRDREHRWIAAFLVWTSAADVLRTALSIYVLRDAPRPFVGLPRVVFHLDQLVYLSWSFLFVALCIHYFLRRRSLAPYGTWAFILLIFLNYPLVRGALLGWIYQAVAIWCTAASWLCIGWAMTRRDSDIEPGLAHLTLMLFAMTEVALNLVPYARNIFEEWALVRHANLLTRAAIITAHVVWLVKHHRAARAARREARAGPPGQEEHGQAPAGRHRC